MSPVTRPVGWFRSEVVLGILAMAAIVAASNYLVTIPVTTVFGLDIAAATGLPVGDYVQWAAVSYPVAFLVTDVMNRVYGPGPARRVILAGFLTGVVCSWMLGDARVALASGTAFLAAQMLDVAIFNRLRDGVWWKAPLVSSLICGTLDSAIFWPLAFSGRDFFPGGWLNYTVVDWAVKIAVTIAMLVPFRVIVRGLLTTR